jgi:high-affinity iron transporter
VFEGLFPSFIITFREALEAALIIAIMASYLNKIGRPNLNRYTYLGAGSAILVSVILGSIVWMVYGGLHGVSSEIFEGVASLTAVAVLTYMIFWMSEQSRKIRGEIEEKIDFAVTRGGLVGIAMLAFIAVFREGVETVLFLTATFFLDPVGVIIGAALGTIIVLVLAILLMKGVYRLDIRSFFRYSSIILIVFAAGLAGYGVHELIEAGEGLGIEFGILSQHAFDINPPINTDGSYPLLHENGIVGSILKALIGYDGNPEWLRVIVYIAYWMIVGTYTLKNYWKN